MAGFSSNKKKKTVNGDKVKESAKSVKSSWNKRTHVSSRPNPKSNKNQTSQRKFNVDEKEASTLAKRADSDVNEKDLAKLHEKVEIPNYIPNVKDCDESLFIHMINHSKMKTFPPFIMGKVDTSISENIDRYIKESKSELNPNDYVDLSDGDRLKTLKR